MKVHRPGEAIDVQCSHSIIIAFCQDFKFATEAKLRQKVQGQGSIYKTKASQGRGGLSQRQDQGQKHLPPSMTGSESSSQGHDWDMIELENVAIAKALQLEAARCRTVSIRFNMSPVASLKSLSLSFFAVLERIYCLYVTLRCDLEL